VSLLAELSFFCNLQSYD